MNIPTLYHFTEALEAPDLLLATLRDCQPRRTATGGIAMSRTSRFAEVEIRWNGARYLLCFPLSGAAIFSVEQTAAKLKYLQTELLTDYLLLRDEMIFTDDEGQPHHCDLILHRLPDGEPLNKCVWQYDAETLLRRVDELEQGLLQLDFHHNNLKAENLIVTPQGRLIPIRYHFARFGSGSDAEQFEALRRLIREEASAGMELHEPTAPAYRTRPEFTGHLFVGEMSDMLIRVEDEAGYGYVDTSNRTVIAPQFIWAADFREGRAEVQTAEGMGLIDKQGRHVIEPRYEIVDFNPYTGCTRLRREGLWALADYNGRIATEFTPRYIEEDEYIEV